MSKVKIEHPVKSMNEENPGVKYKHPELYIKYLEDVIDTYYKTYTLKDQEWQTLKDQEETV